jgi:hypothetical protein
MGRVKTGSSALSEGGNWSDIDVEITQVVAKKVHQFIKQDGSKGKASKSPGVYVEYVTEDGRTISDFFALSKGLLPAASAKDAEANVSSDEGDFLMSENGSGQGRTFGWGVYIDNLQKAGYNTDTIDDEGFSSLIGERVHLVNVESGGKDAEGKPYRARVPSKYYAGSVQPKGNGAADTTEADTVAVLADVLKAAGQPLFKAKANQLFGNAVKESRS